MIDASRRYVMRATVLSFLNICASGRLLAQRAVRANGSTNSRLNWDAFIEQLDMLAKERRFKSWNQHAYVGNVAGLARDLGLPKNANISPDNSGARRSRLYPEFTDLRKTIDVQITLINFRSGERIPHHDHPEMTGVMLCAAGQVTVKEYDWLNVPVSSGCLLKASGTKQLAAGQVSTLTATERNVHAVSAAEFSQVIDIFTPPYNTDRMARTRWLELERFPLKGTEDTFLAHPYGG